MREVVFESPDHHHANAHDFIRKLAVENEIVGKFITFNEIVEDAPQFAKVFKSGDVFKKIMTDQFGI